MPFYATYLAYTAIGAATLLPLAVLLIWPTGQPESADGPSTGESCTEYVDRIWPTMMSSRPPNPVEKRNMLLCHDALKERLYLEQRSRPDHKRKQL